VRGKGSRLHFVRGFWHDGNMKSRTLSTVKWGWIWRRCCLYVV